MKKFNKVYMPVDAIANHEDFKTWYEDGDLFMTFTGEWVEEKNKVSIFGRLGGESAWIKPDYKVLGYYLKIERYEFVLHTYRIFKHYFAEGLKWGIYDSPHNVPIDYINEENGKKEVHVRKVTFKDHGECYEVRCNETNKLRHALMVLVGMLIKEEYRGLSEGEPEFFPGRLQKIWNNIAYKGFTPEEVEQEMAKLEAMDIVVAGKE